MSLPTCTCPHVATAVGLTRSGWSRDCPFHGELANPAAWQPGLPVIGELVIGTSNTTRDPCPHCKGTGVKQP